MIIKTFMSNNRKHQEIGGHYFYFCLYIKIEWTLKNL